MKTNIEIIITNDYEIFGNGSGDIKKCLIEPTDKIFGIADEYGVAITLMADICEYWAFRNEENAGNLPQGYKPAGWIEEQLIRGINSGHDIQLHLHPQWINYRYHRDKNKWEVDLNSWKLSSLGYERIYEILKKSKDDLERLLKPFKPDYECFAFRAGAWGIQPEKYILKALLDAGFKLDTTAAPGCILKSRLTSFDFSKLPGKPYWFAQESLNRESPSGIIELPIFTRKYSVYGKIYYKIIRMLKKEKREINNSGGTVEDMPRSSLIKKLLPAYVMFDFCEQSDYEMLAMLKNAKDRYENLNWVPLVIMGHSKAFTDTNNFERFIKKALGKGYKFITFKDVVNRVSAESFRKI